MVVKTKLRLLDGKGKLVRYITLHHPMSVDDKDDLRLELAIHLSQHPGGAVEAINFHDKDPSLPMEDQPFKGERNLF